jgi:PEGA domain
VIATAPAGASVSIDGAAPLESPVKVDSIQPGKHRVQIAMAGREPVDMNVDVKGSKTTDLGTVALQTLLGTLQLSSSPDGLDFAVRAVGDPAGVPVRTGRTPATFDDIPHGEYVITYTRPGCIDHVAKVSVVKGRTSTVGTTYVNGSLDLSSDPSGAWVEKDGERLGTTPLVVHDLTPKRSQFLLTLPGYDPTPVSCDIPEGQTVKMEAELLRRDRVFNASEVKTAPVPYETPPPVLSAAQKKLSGEVLLSFVVRLDGSVGDVTVEKAFDDEVARRCKTAVEGWRYRAATAADDRIVDSKVEKLFKFPLGGQ